MTEAATGFDAEEFDRQVYSALKDIMGPRVLPPSTATKRKMKGGGRDAKKLTLILIPLSFTGHIDIPLDPYFYAMLAIVVSKVGIEAICAGKV